MKNRVEPALPAELSRNLAGSLETEADNICHCNMLAYAVPITLTMTTTIKIRSNQKFRKQQPRSSQIIAVARTLRRTVTTTPNAKTKNKNNER